jgi:GTP-binding protein Era
MILSDTPGIIACIWNASVDDELCKVRFEDADILIYMVERSKIWRSLFNKIIHSKIPVLLLLLNKIDNSNQEQLKQVAFGQRKCLMQKYILYPRYKL